MKKLTSWLAITSLLLFACKVIPINKPEPSFTSLVELRDQLSAALKQKVEDSSSLKLTVNYLGAGYLERDISNFEKRKAVDSLSLQTQKEFAYLINLVPTKKDSWASTGSLLWNEYISRLRFKISLDSLENFTEADRKVIQESRALIDKYHKTYNSFSTPYLDILTNYQQSKLNNDSASMTELKRMAEVINNKWISTGYKLEFEKAVNSIEIIQYRNKLNLLADAIKEMSPIASPYYVSDPDLQDYYVTSFYPQMDDILWQKAEVLYDGFNFPEKDSELVKGESKLIFEYGLVYIYRPWFHPEFILPLSIVGTFKPPKISYINSILLVRKVYVNYKAKSLKDVVVKEPSGYKSVLKKGSVTTKSEQVSDSVKVVGFICYFEN